MQGKEQQDLDLGKNGKLKILLSIIYCYLEDCSLKWSLYTGGGMDREKKMDIFFFMLYEMFKV